MAIMCGQVENDDYGTIHHLSELLKIDASSYEVVFDEDGPPTLIVKFWRRKVLECFPEALLNCVEGGSVPLPREGVKHCQGPSLACTRKFDEASPDQ